MTTESIRRRLERCRALLKQDKKLLLMLCGAAVLTVLLLLPAGEKNNKAQPEQPLAQTTQTLEAELCDLLGAIEGVGDVRVMLRTASSGETVYAANTDGAAETRDAQTSKKEKNSVVIVKNAQGESGLVVKTTLPAVTGAAVVCKGGGDPVVRARVTETIRALFGLSTNHISVMPM